MSLTRDRSTIGKLRQQVAVLERRLDYSRDVQLLLLNKLIAAGDDARGNPCPTCGHPLIDLRSLELRICSGCDREYGWPLGAEQAPLVGNNRQRGKSGSPSYQSRKY